jgi:protein SCO1/2
MTPFTRILLATVAVVTALAIAMIWPQPDSRAPGQMELSPGVANIGGSFALTDHKGILVTDQDFLGRRLLISFGYTNCPDVCQMMLQNISEVLDLLKGRVTEIEPLFISFDPDRDTPEVLAEHLDNFHPAIRGLTGTPEEVADTAKAYRVYYEKVSVEDPENVMPENYVMEHSSLIYLMDRNGLYAAHFSHHMAPADLAGAILGALND